MLEILLYFAMLAGSLAVLIGGADLFTKAAERIGLAFGMSSFVVGATIVSIGSSSPELITSIFGVMRGVSEFPISNAIGSNIANCALVGGICALAVKQLKISKRLLDIDLPFFFISTALFILLVLDKELSILDAIICLTLFVVFLGYTLFHTPKKISEEISAQVEKMRRPKLHLLDLGLLVLGGVGIALGAELTIRSVTSLASLLQISSSVVTMIAVAIGTSLPELIVSVQSCLRGKHSVALGNIFGSNVFNILVVTGVPTFWGTVTVSPHVWSLGLPFLAATTLAFIFTTSDDQVQSWEGAALLVLYGAFVGKIIGVI